MGSVRSSKWFQHRYLDFPTICIHSVLKQVPNSCLVKISTLTDSGTSTQTLKPKPIYKNQWDIQAHLIVLLKKSNYQLYKHPTSTPYTMSTQEFNIYFNVWKIADHTIVSSTQEFKNNNKKVSVTP